MPEQADARKLRLLEDLREHDGQELGEYARRLHVDERTIRRDVESLQELIGAVRSIEVRRGRVYTSRDEFGPGYFSAQLQVRKEAKQAVARAIVGLLPDNTAVVLTAGTSTYYVAREIRRAALDEARPRSLVAHTNSLPALLELIAGGVSTGIAGEVYDPEDRAFHTHDLRSAFHPEIAIVGASGIVANAAAGTLDLFTQSAQEAAFMKPLLARAPSILIAADTSKIGRRHPWSYTDGETLAGKAIHLFTDMLDEERRRPLDLLSAALDSKFLFDFTEVAVPAAART